MIYLLGKMANKPNMEDTLVIVGAFQTLGELRKFASVTQLEYGFDWAYTDITIGSPRVDGFIWRAV